MWTRPRNGRGEAAVDGAVRRRPRGGRGRGRGTATGGRVCRPWRPWRRAMAATTLGGPQTPAATADAGRARGGGRRGGGIRRGGGGSGGEAQSDLMISLSPDHSCHESGWLEGSAFRGRRGALSLIVPSSEQDLFHLLVCKCVHHIQISPMSPNIANVLAKIHSPFKTKIIWVDNVS